MIKDLGFCYPVFYVWPLCNVNPFWNLWGELLTKSALGRLALVNYIVFMCLYCPVVIYHAGSNQTHYVFSSSDNLKFKQLQLVKLFKVDASMSPKNNDENLIFQINGWKWKTIGNNWQTNSDNFKEIQLVQLFKVDTSMSQKMIYYPIVEYLAKTKPMVIFLTP